jgi:hypothetical protein
MESRLPPTVDPMVAMNETCWTARDMYQKGLIRDDDIETSVAGLAAQRVYRENAAWLPGLTGDKAVTYLGLMMLAELDADSRSTVEDAATNALRIMGEKRAVILLLRHLMGFGAGCDPSRIVGGGTEALTYGGRVWAHPSEMILPCPDCVGVNGFNNERIATVAGVGQNVVPAKLDEARSIWVEQMSGSRNGGR